MKHVHSDKIIVYLFKLNLRFSMMLIDRNAERRITHDEAKCVPI